MTLDKILSVRNLLAAIVVLQIVLLVNLDHAANAIQSVSEMTVVGTIAARTASEQASTIEGYFDDGKVKCQSD
ncbi:MAG: hypothetical protein ACT4OG_02960 [Alphaproteobacteria bacterium]